MTHIVDYGMGNLGSVRNMIARIGGEAEVTSDPDVVRRAHRLILPGVGSFGRAMETLRATGLADALTARVVGDGVPVLGVCLGMQLLTHGSAESPGVAGLGWIAGETVRFPFDGAADGAAAPLRLPHMGWNTLDWSPGAPLAPPPDVDARYYFVHTFCVRCERREDVMARATYGVPFDAAVAVGNIVGTQFHPEKSHRFGMALLRRFLAFEPRPAARPVAGMPV